MQTKARLLSDAASAATSSLGLSPAESEERQALRESLRSRHSVDHFALGWYGSIASLILTGVLIKLWVDQPGFRWVLLAVAVASLVGWIYAARHLMETRRLALIEKGMLLRLSRLELRAPKAPELF